VAFNYVAAFGRRKGKKMKYTKAKALAKTGQYHFTFETLWKKLPKELIGKSTAKNLAIIIDLMYEQKEYGHSEAWRELSS
jgi:hypothetical protein